MERGTIATLHRRARSHFLHIGFLRYWNLKRVTILVGFLLTMLGSVGSYLYVEPAQNRAGSVDETLKSLAVQIEVIKNATSQYFMFEQQGSLIFAISAANTNSDAKEDIARLRQISLLDQTFAVRQIFGQLAIAGQLNYRETSDAYQQLIDAARRDFSLPNFMAVKGFEAKYVNGADKQSGQLQIRRTALIQEKAADDREVDQRKLILLVLTSLGSAFLLAANLIATKEPSSAEGGEAAA